MIPFLARARRRREEAEAIYAAAVRAARRPELFLVYGVPDTLDGRFEMIALHLFPVFDRLMHEPGDDPELARLVSESFVRDMDAAFREMGVGDLMVPKRMTTLYRSFAGRIAAYRAALGEGVGGLAAAIARNVFPDGGEAGHALALAEYVDASVAALRRAARDDLRGGGVPYPRLAPHETIGSEP
jgi:cytochrome b pre-mRNA-processing protein 3